MNLYGFTRITVSDPDAGESFICTTVSVTNGKLFIGNAFGAKLTGNSSAVLTLIGNQSAISSKPWRIGLHHHSSGARGATMTVRTNDQGSPALETVNTVPIQIVNRAPDRLDNAQSDRETNTPLTVGAGLGLLRWFSDANSDNLIDRRVEESREGQTRRESGWLVYVHAPRKIQGPSKFPSGRDGRTSPCCPVDRNYRRGVTSSTTTTCIKSPSSEFYAK